MLEYPANLQSGRVCSTQTCTGGGDSVRLTSQYVTGSVPRVYSSHLIQIPRAYDLALLGTNPEGIAGEASQRPVSRRPYC